MESSCIFGRRLKLLPGWTPPLLVFPNDSSLDSAYRSTSSEVAKALLRLKGGRIADDAISVIEDWIEPSSPVATASLLAELDERIEIYRSNGDQTLLRTTLKARAMIAASTDEEPDEDPRESSFRIVPAASLIGDWHSDVETACLIVDGDLSVEGVLALNDLGETLCVVVLGSLRARNLDCGGWVFVRDDLACEHLHACSLNDGILAVGGSMRVQTYLETGTYTQVGLDLRARFLSTVQNEIVVEGAVHCPDFSRRSDPDYLSEWVDPELLERVESDSDGCESPWTFYPSEAYRLRIIASRSPMNSKLCD
nr:hypothetical protein [Stenotrophomonas geniculata]